MNLDSLSLSLSQIGFIFANLTKKNLKQASQELSRIISKYGLEAEVCILKRLLTESIKSWNTDSSSSSSHNIHTSILAQHLTSLLNHPARVTAVCQSISQSVLQKASKPPAGFIETLSKSLKLTTAEDVAISLILKNSPSTELVALINQHLKKKFPELIQSYLDSDHIDRSGLQDCSIEVLQLILSNLISKDLPVAAVTTNLFLKQLRSDFKRDLVPIVLAPLLYPDDTRTPLEEMITNKDISSTIMDSPLAEMVRDLGYSFTSSIEECKNNMLNIMVREPTAADVAKIISMMIKYHTTNPDDAQLQAPSTIWMSHQPKKDSSGHNNSWNAEVFVQTLKELIPNLNWKDVILQLDNPDFVVPDKLGLALLFKILRLGLQSAAFSPDIFPVEHLYRHWTNIEGQMSLIIHILKHPDIFSFADCPFNLVSIDILKLPPELNNKEIATWRCVNLVELLLHAAERGYYIQVHELFKFPMQHCPDVLLLALLQINSPITVLRHELLTTLIPIFLENHPNSGTILHLVWQTQNLNIKPIMMHALVDWYIRGEYDQSKLSRILDVAQDLKALSLLLNIQSFPFVIDLACLASRREYLKLDKWLADKIRDLGENFIMAIVKFLQRRCPQVIGNKITEDQLPLAAQLPVETISTMLACLQLCIPNVRPELQDAIYTVVSNCQALIINKTRQNIAGILRPPSVIDTPYSMGMGGLFAPHAMDPVSNLASNVANINLGAAASTAFAMHGMSPSATTQRPLSRIGVNSPFGMNPLQHNIKMGTMADMERIPPAAAAVDKPEILHFKEMMTTVSKEIEDEANSYFQRIYNHPPHPTLSIDEVLLILQKFQESPNKRENDVYTCMLRNLFEEYKFFPQYPDKELYTTAQLFGGIIEKGLVPSYVCLGLALRLVLEALHKPVGSKMYNFGIVAIDRFKPRLKDYQKYCERVRTIQHFNEFPPHLIEYIECGLQSQEPPSKPQGSVLPPGLAAKLSLNVNASASPYRSVSGSPSPGNAIVKATTTAAANISTRPSIATATNIDTLLTATDREDNLIVPPENVQDKTAFIFNNLSLLNLPNKCEELREIVHEKYYPWLAQYLVMNRASIEINFHPLYSSFLEDLKQTVLIKLVVRETYRNIKVLLQSDKGIANFSDRSLLKNLGHWLGLMTLARNKPILYIDIDLKSMLLEAYHKGQQDLLYVVPFVAKIVESCAKSIVFKPPNPWTMAIMNVLAELHQEPDLKLNLKFEIEVLCKNLSLDIAELKPTVYLRDARKLKQIDSQLSQPKPSEVENVQPMPTPIHNIQTPIPVEMTPAPVMPTPGVTEAEAMPEPRFNYLDVNITSKSELGSKLSYNPHIILFQKYPHLKQLVIPTIERSIQEWIHPVVDRSIKYALTTCEHIIKKDFALDHDEIRMRDCAHFMMRNLTAGMAMITCREQVVSTITTNLKAAFLAALLPANTEQKDIVESAAAVLASENMELSCAFIQKTAVEKALVELDKRLMSDYEIRKLARSEGRHYCDSFVLKYQLERMPEPIRLRVGSADEKQLLVYEEFACNIPGFIPVRGTNFLINKSAQKPAFTHPLSQVMNLTQTYGADDLSTIIAAAEQFLANTIGTPAYTIQSNNIQALVEYLMIVRRNCDIVTACALLQKGVEGLLDGYVIQPASTSDRIEMLSRYRDIHLRLLKFLEFNPVYGRHWTHRQIAYCLTECREELRYNLDAVDCLIRNNLVDMKVYDSSLAHLIETGNNKMAVSFGMRLVHAFVNEIDLSQVAEALLRVSRARPAIDTLAQDAADAPLGDVTLMGPTANIHAGIQHVRSREYNDPPGLKEKTENLICEWRTALLEPLTEIEIAQSFNLYIHRMNMIGVLKSDDMITRFFRIATQMAIEDVYQLLNDDKNSAMPTLPKRENYYRICDSLTKLISLLIKNTSDSGHPTPKLNLLNKILGIIAGCLIRDQEERGTNFQQLPYHRLLLMLFLDMNMNENVSDSINFLVVTSFCHTLHLIRPSVAPGFCYSWLEIISYRLFIDRVMAGTPQKGWGMYSTLLINQLKFLEPFLRNPELPPPVKLLYKGTLKVLLVLLHDFPEFLCDYTHALCDEIPPNCIQMRNLVLSAFPRKMRLLDPFTPNLKVDLLPEIALLPRSAINYATLIPTQQFKEELDAYLRDRAPVTFLSDLRSRMQLENGGGYDVRLINAVVQYVGAQALATVRSRSRVPSLATIAHTAHMDIFQNFTVDFDYEGRYHFLNAIGNQLRYPNSHTHYFSCCLLYLFAEANSEAIQEQITRMLLERLIVNRPHPWGLLVTFIELIKNPSYKFWTHDFVHCAPEIEKSQCISRFKPSMRIVGSSATV